MGDQFATIDFERTSDFCPNVKGEEILETLKVGEEQDEIFANGERFCIFKQKGFAPLRQLPDHDVISSLVQLSKEVRTWRNIGIAAVVAFLSLTLTLLNFQNNLYRDNRSLTDQVYMTFIFALTQLSPTKRKIGKKGSPDCARSLMRNGLRMR